MGIFICMDAMYGRGARDARERAICMDAMYGRGARDARERAICMDK